ncbi:sensor domain-containing diguanylate cyclase [Alkalihalobacillus sp. LMS39]|uniref:sensor domain-containing diguanylate cyclase n=1 Tax=Alkalihalobacillus sp. LMS39 TaxID=2924032 RepID=UPI001FB45AC3|nr:sensor domain-containing diguanylate cyclase [Alkalihalobacillus sp. LMS39]UOE92490.1 sensor domain-containing diguanylate cyclase [Alkalihalobacillus sp. LMS39]
MRTDEFGSQFPHFIAANVLSYIGVPIILKNGEVFGSLCAVDSKPTIFTEEEKQFFTKIARLFSYVVELERLAIFDSLTGLYNRHFLYENVELQNPGSILFLDLDGFKMINDDFGHDIGDFVLKEVANRLKALTKNYPDSYAVRLGGDEFVIVVPQLIDKDDIADFANQVIRMMDNWQILDKKLQLTTSIGIVRYPSDGKDIKLLLKFADLALYRAKAKGKNNYQFY